MKTKITLHFYAKSTKMNVNGSLPIYVRLTINGERTEFSSKKFIDKAKCSPELAKMQGNMEEARSINSYLDMMRSKVLSAEMDLIHKDEAVSLQNVQSIIKGLYKNHRTLIPIFQDHNAKMKELVGKKYAYGTLQRFEVTLNHIQNFLLWKHNASDILINKIDHAMITDLEFYLRSIKNCANNTAVKYIRNFRKIIKICLNNDWLEKNPFSKYEGKVYEVDKEFFIVKNNYEKLNVLQAKTRIATKFNPNQVKVAVIQLKEKLEIQPILYLKNSELALENLEKNIQIMDPVNVLKRGFSITYSNGKALKDVSQLEEGAAINTLLFNGTIDSTITKIKE